jgi:chromosomal replication initiator protein
MVVRIDPPARPLRETILRTLADRAGVAIEEEAILWIAQRVTQNVRELEGAVTRIGAHVKFQGRRANVELAAEILHDLDRQLRQPLRPDQIFDAVCEFFALERRELMSGRRQRTISLARSVAMYLTRKCTNLSYPDIAGRMGKRNHSTVISACRRIETAVKKNQPVSWSSSIGDRSERAGDLVQRLEEQSRALACS